MINNIKNYKISYIVSCIYTVAIVAIYNFTNGNFNTLISYSNGLFIAGSSLICISALSIVTYYGSFDMFTYLFENKNTPNGRLSLYDYTEVKKNKRKSHKYRFISYLIVGATSIGFSIILIIFI